MGSIKRKMICTECFEILEPNAKNSIAFGYPDEGTLSICHAPPCGDGLNEDDSKLIDVDDLEGIIHAARDRVELWKSVSNDLGKDLDFCRELLMGKGKYVHDFKIFLEKKRKELYPEAKGKRPKGADVMQSALNEKE